MSSHIEVKVKRIEPRTVAYIGVKGPFSRIGETMGRLYHLVMGRGYAVAGMPLGVYFNSPQEVPEEELLWEIQFPVGGEVAPGGPDDDGLGVKRVEPYEVAATVHKGPYSELSKVYQDLVPWIMENGYEIAGPAEEVYMNDPQSVPKEEILTEVRFVVRKK